MWEATSQEIRSHCVPPMHVHRRRDLTQGEALSTDIICKCKRQTIICGATHEISWAQLSVWKLEARVGFEPTIEVLQDLSLKPLGYRAHFTADVQTQ